MVNGNYIMYGDRPLSDSEIVEDHVAGRRSRRKAHRSAAELPRSLRLAQLDNETDAAKCEKRVNEPRLLRYVPTGDVEEHYVPDKYETYDLQPTAATPRRYTFKKKPRNPADGSVNYAHSRSSSSCSSPGGHLPPIAELAEQPARRARSPPVRGRAYESKLDKYFTKPKDIKNFAVKGSHPDSLYRVPAGAGAGAGKMARALRIMRWPVALVVVCVALAVFVYFLMPENLQSLEARNATYWESTVADADTHRAAHTHSDRPHTQDPRTPEIDFYDAKNGNIEHTVASAVTDKISQRKLPAPPVFPAHLTPEVQYGNENADTGNPRTPKIMHKVNAVPADSTLKPHITQKPEKPLAIYFKDGEGITTTTTTEAISRATTVNDYANYGDKNPRSKIGGQYLKPYAGLSPLDNKEKNIYVAEPALPPEMQDYFKRISSKKNYNFTSGHSKLFGISIEDAERMQSTTQSSVYNTRVSPTLPTWRGDDATTIKYPVNVNPDECRSTSLPLCRGVLPYDLAARPAVFDGVSVGALLPQIEYLIATNCSARVKNFVCALLEPECSPPPQPPKMPCYNLCRAILDGCEGEVPRELSPAFNCQQYGSASCVGARAPCSPRELACGDGSCVPRDWICDGARDCPAGEDEAPCAACGKNEFRCESGACIHRRWACDGYADCPDGDDEAEAECAPQPAGSAPAPAVRRPDARSGAYARDADSSKELLITSDSSNALKRNFTRRPSLSRLSPYSPPMLQESKKKPKHQAVEDKTPTKKTDKQESGEDVNAEDLGFWAETGKRFSERKPKNQTKLFGRAPMPKSMQITSFDDGPDSTKLDKTINKLERVIDGSALLKKAEEAAVAADDYQDSAENSTAVERLEETTARGAGAGEGRAGGAGAGGAGAGGASAHASPCPSGELRCVDGRCITLAQLCDGTIDCTDHADEDNCYT